MATKIKSADYLYITAYIRAKENGLLNRERAERMISAKTLQDALKVLEECGYGEMAMTDSAGLDEKLRRKRDSAIGEIAPFVPNREIIDIFRIKYDYHNAKTLIKSEAAGKNPDALLSGAGRYSTEKFVSEYNRGNFDAFSPILGRAVREARDTLAKTGDSQLCDFILDDAYFKEYLTLADETGSEFFKGYARLMIDCANLRSAVRAVRMGKNGVFLKRVLSEGGNVPAGKILSGISVGKSMQDIFTDLKGPAELGDGALGGGGLTKFEKACDDALTDYLKNARYISYGPEAVVSYLCDVENELSAVRIITAGKRAGLTADTIRERLRSFRN